VWLAEIHRTGPETGPSDSKMQIFSALKGRYLGTINEVSQHPYTLFGM